MDLVAALVVSTLINVNEPTRYDQVQTWDGPTMVDLGDCADMAQSLTTAYKAIVDAGRNDKWQDKWVTCEIYPASDTGEERAPRAAPASFKF